METRVERVVLETDRYRISGDLTLPREGYRSRLSDFLNRGDVDFIPLVNVEIAALNGAKPGLGPDVRSFIAVARTHVQLAYPFEDEG
jgi:hypothetical protein